MKHLIYFYELIYINFVWSPKSCPLALSKKKKTFKNKVFDLVLFINILFFVTLNYLISNY